MAATLTQGIAEVRSLIDEPVPQFWSNAELTSWINAACSEIQRTVEWAQKGPTPVAAVAAQQMYLCPPDLLRLHRLEFVPTNNLAYTYSLEFRGYNEMDAAWGNLKSLPSAYPEQFTLWNNPDNSGIAGRGLTIVLYPVPAVAGTLNLYYFRAIAPVALASDFIDVLPGWETVVYNWVAYRAFRKDADPRWRDFQEESLAQLEGMKTVSRTYTDQANWFSTGAQNYNPLFLELD